MNKNEIYGLELERQITDELCIHLCIKHELYNSAGLSIGIRGKLFDTWKGSYPAKIVKGKDDYVAITLKHDVIFEQEKLDFRYIEKIRLGNTGVDQNLEIHVPLEIRNQVIFWSNLKSAGRDLKDVLQEHQELLARREHMRSRGLGAPVLGGCTYKAVVFLNQVYFTNRIDYFDFIVEPFDPLGMSNIYELVMSFFKKYKIGVDGNRVREIIDSSGHQPTALVLYPKIHARDLEECHRIVYDEAKSFMNLAALNRQSHGEILCAIVAHFGSDQINIFLNTPTYRGNLLGGFISGEDVEETYTQIASLRINARAKLYFELYNETRRELSVDFRFFRLWNILETIAKTKNYVGRPLLDWAGQQVCNIRGIPRTILEHTKEQVFELLRESLSGINVQGYFGSKLNARTNDELIDRYLTVWYQHRNCTAHRGACLPSDQTICDPTKASCITCKTESFLTYSENNSTYELIDHYYDVLDRCVATILRREIC
ncbi:MAG: hypothetical protein HYV97_02325 [Bdellovibrio sp.]|nr:hypothetical protein [Bdellovibrio sp.]